MKESKAKKLYIAGMVGCLCISAVALGFAFFGKRGIFNSYNPNKQVYADINTCYTAHGEPSVNVGRVGDTYFDLNNLDYYVKTVNGWIRQGRITGGTNGRNGVDGIGILSIVKTSTSGNVDTYTITLTDNSTVTFTVTNGKDGVRGAQGQRGNDGETPVITIGANGNWQINGVDTGIPARGAQGEKGADGVSIVSVVKTDTEGLVDTYTIYFSNGETSTFTVTNGSDGGQGIQGLPGNDGHTPIIIIGDDGNWYIDGLNSGIKAQGPKGDQGEAGRGIESIEYYGSNDLVDTYIITYTDGTVSYFTVTNGADGGQGIQGPAGNDGVAPTITIGSNGHWYINGTDTGIPAQGPQGDQGDTGPQGDKGDTGRSITNTEINENGHLIISFSDGTTQDAGQVKSTDTCTVTWHYNDTTVTTTVFKGTHAVQPDEFTAPDGNVLQWYITDNGEEEYWKLYAYTVYQNIDLFGKLVPIHYTAMLNTKGGSLFNSMYSYAYGEAYTLPTPSNTYGPTINFDGWYDSDEELFPITGTWDTRENVDLHAKWSGALTVDANGGTCSETTIPFTWDSKYFTFGELPTPTAPAGYKLENWYLYSETNGTLPRNAASNSTVYATYRSDGTITARYIDEDFTISGSRLYVEEGSNKESYYIPAFANGSNLYYITAANDDNTTKYLTWEAGQMYLNPSNLSGFGSGLETFTMIESARFYPYNSSAYVRVYADTFAHTGSTLTKVILTNPITRIENNAFRGCTALTELTLPSGLRYIGSGNFNDVTNLIIRYNLPKNSFNENFSNGAIFNGATGHIEVHCSDGVIMIN